MDTIRELVSDLARLAKNASYRLAVLNSDEKNRALQAMASGLDQHRSQILSENRFDIARAKEDGQPEALLDRLLLNSQRIDAMIEGISAIINLSDPVGKLITSRNLPNGLELKKIRVPIGVIGIIFESRPNVIADVAALCLKSGNAVILRGGKEADNTNRAIMTAIDDALKKIDFCPFAVQMVPTLDRAAVSYLCQEKDLVDLIIPRGGEGLINAVSECATVPVIKHYKGICHIYVDAEANEEMALAICHNAKCQRPGVCNAAETILVHEAIAASFLPKLLHCFTEEGVEMRGDERARTICPSMVPAEESDWRTEYLDKIVSIKVIESTKDAINHINYFGSHHSDAIVSADKAAQLRFTKEVDSAAVYVNASTRFTDGYEFGLGAEMGISTDKLHARGPMGLEELTTYKWVGIGNGQIR